GRLDPAGVDKYFERVVEHFPDHYDAYFKMGMVREVFNLYDQALAAYSHQLDVNPEHDAARAKMAQAALVLMRDGEFPFGMSELADFVEKDPVNFLPLLAETAVKEGDLGRAEEAYTWYVSLLKPGERDYYEDLKLLVTPEEQQAFDRVYSRPDQDLFRKKFWMEHDPTPTTPVNERRVEHFRRVNYSRLRFSQGVQPWDGRGWDRRGDVYIRLGHPDHRSRADRLVFETDPEVVKVKNRLNVIAERGMEEILASKHSFGQTTAAYGYGVGPQTSDIKGMPTFPLPNRKTWMPDGTELGYKWESWIYAQVGGGIEVTFLDLTGKGFYDYAIPPPNSRNYKLWQRLAPEAVVARVTNQTPSVYEFDYGGDPLRIYVYTADFKVSDWDSNLEIYIGVPWSELGQTVEGGRAYAGVDREVVLYNRKLEPVYRDSARVVESMPVSEVVGPGTLLVDQVRARVPANTYLMAIQVRDPATRKIQIQKRYVVLKPFWNKAPALSGIEVAGSVEELEGPGDGKFDKGELRVVPLPSKVFVKGQLVYLYYEIYDLVRNEFGQTRYRVDYLLHGVEQGSTITRIFKGLGRALGQVPKAEGLQISYEHEGTSDREPIYVALDVTPLGKEEMEVTVTVTDLNTEGEKSVDRKVRFSFGE
ncbi:MAG: GWxTD domain-containing protein, partial [bacterium]|nr:GWxTD domain-containing protein [bacterium]